MVDDDATGALALTEAATGEAALAEAAAEAWDPVEDAGLVMPAPPQLAITNRGQTILSANRSNFKFYSRQRILSTAALSSTAARHTTRP